MTRDFINGLRTPAGHIDKAMLRALGVATQKNGGWIGRLVGGPAPAAAAELWGRRNWSVPYLNPVHLPIREGSD